MRRGEHSLKRSTVTPLKRATRKRFSASTLQRFNAFALYEVLLGVMIFAIGVIALGRAVENCLTSSTISAEESVVRQILSDRMAEVQAAPGAPDAEKQFKINTAYGMVKLLEKSAPVELTEPDNTLITGVILVTLTAQWTHAGVPQSKQIQFYVYRPA